MIPRRTSASIARYRARGFWGGCFVGGLAGAFAAGQFVQTWAADPLRFVGAVVATAIACAVIGLLFVEAVYVGPIVPPAPETAADATATAAEADVDVDVDACGPW